MTRIKQGWQLTKKSWAVLKQHRDLLRFPLYGGVATLLLAIIVVGPGLYLIDDDKVAPGAPLVIIGVYLLTFVGVFFSVALASCANKIFQGQETSVSDGMAVARGKIPQIAGWAALSATVGLLFSLLENQGGIVGQIIGRLLDIAWALITFLAVPVIAIEGTGPTETFKRSASVFKQKWGQQISGNIAIGGAVMLFAILPAIVLIAAGVALWSSSGFGGAILVIVGIAIVAIGLLVSRALSGIFGVALYRYAVNGEAVGGFTPDEFESVVRRKGGGPTPATI
jgi:hypothetical protein